MAYVLGQELYNTFAEGSDSGPQKVSVSVPLTIRAYYGGEITERDDAAWLEITLFIDGNRVGSVSALNAGVNIEGSTSFNLNPGQTYVMRATQKNRNATARKTWIRGEITVTDDKSEDGT